MIEIPEAGNLAQEMRMNLVGRRIVRMAAAASPRRLPLIVVIRPNTHRFRRDG